MAGRLPSGPLVATATAGALLLGAASAGAAGPHRPDPSGLLSSPDTVPDGLASELLGRVVSQRGGEGVSEAELRLRRLIGDSVADSVTHVTGEEGTFRIERLPAGTYELLTDHIGYTTRRDSIRVPGRKSIRLEIPLAVDPVRVRSLSVEVRAGWLVETGFYRRKERGFGKFLPPEELERRPLNDLSQALGTVPGVRFVRACDGVTCRQYMVTPNTRPTCRVQYYMDGDRMHGQVHPRNISMRSIAAIEVYRSISATPAQFYGQCGSVVMWSKR